MTTNQSKLPALKDLYAEKDLIIANQSLNILLNAEPKPEWTKDHPFIKGYKYIPIERLEYLMTNIFSKWRVEIKSVQLIANSVVVAVRVHYLDPISGEWDWTDGVGATPIQVDKDFGATDFSKMKSSAIQMSAPSAETYAIKDAIEKLGKIFGKDLNRKDIISYSILQETVNNFDNEKVEIQKHIDNLNACKNRESLNAIWSNIPVKYKTNEDVVLAKDNQLMKYEDA